MGLLKRLLMGPAFMGLMRQFSAIVPRKWAFQSLQLSVQSRSTSVLWANLASVPATSLGQGTPMRLHKAL